MAFRILLFYIMISMVYINSIQSSSSSLTDDYVLENDFSSSSSNLVNPPPSVFIHPYKFISLLCQQQEQYPAKITRKLCSNYLQLDKTQEQPQQQRGKRVGWTISV